MGHPIPDILNNIREMFMKNKKPKKKELKKPNNKKKSSKWTTFLLLLIFFIGLSVMLYPAISSFWNARTQSEAVLDYDKMIAAMPQEDYTKAFEEAYKYNEKLKTLRFPLIEFNQIQGYEKILDVTGTGIMGYVTIDKIGVETVYIHAPSKQGVGLAVYNRLIRATGFKIIIL